jgi:hypothetical protein
MWQSTCCYSSIGAFKVEDTTHLAPHQAVYRLPLFHLWRSCSVPTEQHDSICIQSLNSVNWTHNGVLVPIHVVVLKFHLPHHSTHIVGICEQRFQTGRCRVDFILASIDKTQLIPKCSVLSFYYGLEIKQVLIFVFTRMDIWYTAMGMHKAIKHKNNWKIPI